MRRYILKFNLECVEVEGLSARQREEGGDNAVGLVDVECGAIE